MDCGIHSDAMEVSVPARCWTVENSEQGVGQGAGTGLWDRQRRCGGLSQLQGWTVGNSAAEFVLTGLTDLHGAPRTLRALLRSPPLRY